MFDRAIVYRLDSLTLSCHAFTSFESQSPPTNPNCYWINLTKASLDNSFGTLTPARQQIAFSRTFRRVGVSIVWGPQGFQKDTNFTFLPLLPFIVCQRYEKKEEAWILPTCLCFIVFEKRQKCLTLIFLPNMRLWGVISTLCNADK